MHDLLSYPYLTTWLLSYSMLASPTPFSNTQTRPHNISTIDPVSSNSSLGLLPPQGPPDFECTVVAVSRLDIQPKDLFLTVIGMLENITQGDFDSRLDRSVEWWLGPNNLVIAATSIDAQPMLRRYLMWAIVRILCTMSEERRVGYHTGVFEPSWHGRKVGTIEVAYARATNDQLSRTKILKSPRANTIGDDQVSWIFEPGGSLMTQWDVAMGTIGALIDVAQHPNHNFDLFFGDFLPFANAIIYYTTRIRPSRLSKSILIRSVAQAAIWALNDGDFQELTVRVLDITQEIAVGGYGTVGSVLSIPRENISIPDS